MIEEAVLREMADGERHHLPGLMKHSDLPPSVESRDILANIVERMVRLEVVIKEDNESFRLAHAEFSLRQDETDQGQATQPLLGV